MEALLDGLLLLLDIFIVVEPLVLHLFAEVVFKIILLFLQLRGECFGPEQVDMLVDVHGLLHQLGVLVYDPLFLEFGFLLEVVLNKSELLVMTHFLFMFEIL